MNSRQQKTTEGKPFAKTKERLLAARLLAEDFLSDERIAAEVGINRTTLHNWKKNPDFQGWVADFQEDIYQKMMRLPIAKKTSRIAKLNEMERRLQLIIDERADANIDAPGGKSGYLAKSIKSVGYGKQTQVVEEVAFDAPLFKEQRAILEQAAKELGQLTDKTELTGAGGGPLVITELVVDRSAAKPLSDEDAEILED